VTTTIEAIRHHVTAALEALRTDIDGEKIRDVERNLYATRDLLNKLPRT
jgi:hypothetical protein